MKEHTHSDKEGYEDHYKTDIYGSLEINSRDEYIQKYESEYIAPYYKGGGTRGYVFDLAVQKMIDTHKSRGQKKEDIKILDAGCGRGELTIYLACLGYNVVGIDISEQGCTIGRNLAKKIDVLDHCEFRATSLEETDLEDHSVDYVIGLAAFHHFIKYEAIAPELHRIMKQDAVGYFADSFGENKLYSIFHDKEKMERLGDVVLTKKKIENFYYPLFEIELIPTDWFVMLDKVYMKILPDSKERWVRKISKFNFKLDRMIPANRCSLFLTGSVLTIISPADNEARL